MTQRRPITLFAAILAILVLSRPLGHYLVLYWWPANPRCPDLAEYRREVGETSYGAGYTAWVVVIWVVHVMRSMSFAIAPAAGWSAPEMARRLKCGYPATLIHFNARLVTQDPERCLTP